MVTDTMAINGWYGHSSREKRGKKHTIFLEKDTTVCFGSVVQLANTRVTKIQVLMYNLASNTHAAVNSSPPMLEIWWPGSDLATLEKAQRNAPITTAVLWLIVHEAVMFDNQLATSFAPIPAKSTQLLDLFFFLIRKRIPTRVGHFMGIVGGRRQSISINKGTHKPGDRQ